jgi:hypothetical protein
VGMPLPTSVRSSTAFPRVCRRGTPRRAPRSPPHAEERESGHASPCFSQTARPWSIGNRDRDGLLPSLLPRHHEWRPAPPRTRRRERVVMPLPASLSVALHLQPQPTFARDSHRSSGEDPGQCRAAPRPPAKGTPRPRPPNRIPSYPCVHHFTPRTRSIATFRSSLTVFRSSPISSSECTGVVDGPHPDRRPRQCPVHPFLTAYAVSQPVEITPHHFHPGGESAPATAFETTAPTLRQSPLLAAKLARTPRVSSHSPGDRTRIALFMIVSVAYGEAR